MNESANCVIYRPRGRKNFKNHAATICARGPRRKNPAGFCGECRGSLFAGIDHVGQSLFLSRNAAWILCGLLFFVLRANHTNAATTARKRNATLKPARCTMKPVMPLESDAPKPVAVATTPWVKLNRPVPRVKSAITSTLSTPKIAAPIPSINCTPTR